MIHYGWSTSHSLVGLGGTDAGGGAGGAGGEELARVGPGAGRHDSHEGVGLKYHTKSSDVFTGPGVTAIHQKIVWKSVMCTQNRGLTISKATRACCQAIWPLDQKADSPTHIPPPMIL
jgi:hypothetical protein